MALIYDPIRQRYVESGNAGTSPSINVRPKFVNVLPDAPAVQPKNSLQRPGKQNNYLPDNGEVPSFIRAPNMNETPTILPDINTGSGRVYKNQLNELPSEVTARVNDPVNKRNLPKLKPVTAEDVGQAVGKGAGYLGNSLGTGYRTIGEAAQYVGEGIYNTAGAFGTGFMQGLNPESATAVKTPMTSEGKPQGSPQDQTAQADALRTRLLEKMPAIQPVAEKPVAQTVTDSAHAPITRSGGGGGGYSGGGSGSVAGYLNSRNANFNAMTRAGAIPVIRGNSTYYDIPLDNGGGSYHESFLAPGMVEGNVLMNRYGNDAHVAGHGLAKEAAAIAANASIERERIASHAHLNVAEENRIAKENAAKIRASSVINNTNETANNYKRLMNAVSTGKKEDGTPMTPTDVSEYKATMLKLEPELMRMKALGL